MTQRTPTRIRNPEPREAVDFRKAMEEHRYSDAAGYLSGDARKILGKHMFDTRNPGDTRPGEQILRGYCAQVSEKHLAVGDFLLVADLIPQAAKEYIRALSAGVHLETGEEHVSSAVARLQAISAGSDEAARHVLELLEEQQLLNHYRARDITPYDPRTVLRSYIPEHSLTHV